MCVCVRAHTRVGECMGVHACARAAVVVGVDEWEQACSFGLVALLIQRALYCLRPL